MGADTTFAEDGYFDRIEKGKPVEVVIVPPDGYEVDKEKSTLGRMVFRRKAFVNLQEDKPLPKTWEELERVSGYFVRLDCELCKASLGTYKNNRNIFSNEKEAEASIALSQLSQLRKVYRQGWEPDWGGHNRHACILRRRYSFVIDISKTEHEFLSFQDSKTALEFLNNFNDLIHKASPLLYG